MNLAPAKHACLDCETRAGKPDGEFENALALCRQNESWKAETAIRRFNEARAKIDERRALLDSAEVACVCWRSETDLVSFHGFGAEPGKQVEGAVVFGFADERAMLGAFREFLNVRCDPDTVLIGHNLDFDLRRLRFRLLANGLQLPVALCNPDQPKADTMKMFCRHFSLDHAEMFVSLGVVLERLGMTNHKDLCAGDQIGALLAAGQTQVVLKYNQLDACAEYELFLRLTGQSAALA